MNGPRIPPHEISIPCDMNRKLFKGFELGLATS
jgi:uncharacterized protein YbaA (DUF1428 family)